MQANSEFGYSVASAGDVNGDGYSDVIIGAYSYDDGATLNEGRCFVYYGNNGGGLRHNLRLYNTDLITPIQRFNIAEPNLFGTGVFAKSPLGRVKSKISLGSKTTGTAF
ncbi:MAG: FG-GAP repeat protein [Chitinophagaceae bacterium]|nr:FG-GAP repeat protein [Chitinophagaceae bacterium]